MEDLSLCYTVGALLYCPGNNDSIAFSIMNNRFGGKFSLALCLEDTINDNSVEEAEKILINSINTIFSALSEYNFYLPKIFIRVRRPEQICRLVKELGESSEIVTGFIIPKVTISNIDDYLDEIIKLNNKAIRSEPFYVMPILEDGSLFNLRDRYDILYILKQKFDSIHDKVLNICVGTNDLCSIYGLRRDSTQTIYEIGAINSLLSDIITVFCEDYVINGPVWEYYNGETWESGLQKELKLDRLNGFIGKTIIHPKQIKYVNDSLKVSRNDYNDAKSIIKWDPNNSSLVSGSTVNDRMNEFKIHYKWAERILKLAEYYGIE